MKFLISLIFCLLTGTSVAKEVKFIIPYSAGGPTDRVTRTVLKYLNDGPYKFIPEYKLGAGGSIAANFVSASKDETVLMITSNALVSSPILTSTTTYDLERDFLLVDYIGTEPLLLVVKGNSEINSFKDFLEHGKKNYMSYGSAGVGTSGHIASAILAQNNKNFVHVPYKGSAGIVIDLLNDQLKWLLDSEINIGSFLKDGKVKPIAVYSNRRLKSFPNIPTVKDLKINDRNFYRWHILVSNKNADQLVLRYVRSKLDSPQLKSEIEALGLNVEKPDLTNFLSTESLKVHAIVKDFQIQEK